MATASTVIWNQTLALSYKNYLHVKRRLASFLCMLLTPFLVVGIIMTLNFLISKYRVVDKLKNSDVTLRGNADLPEFLPKYMIPCNMLNMQVTAKYAEINNYYKIRVWEKYVRYALSERNNDTKAEADKFFRTHPQFFGYGRSSRWPLFYYSEVEDNEELNRNLIKSIQSLGGQRLMARDSRIPDSTVYFNQFDLDMGFDAVIQQQNPRNDNDIRFNGHNYIAFRWDKNDSWSWLRIPTEGYISTMNLLNNKFVLHQINAGVQFGLQNPQLDDIPKIVSFVSPVMDSGLAREVLDSFFGALGVLFVPLALSFGYPALLLVWGLGFTCEWGFSASCWYSPLTRKRE